MDLVYLCRPGDNEELRYSIRSAVQNLPHDKIWVIGAKPDWYGGDFISVPQTASKYQNVRKSLDVICNANSISKDFVLMNDDFFIMGPVETIQPYHGGQLINKVNSYEDLNPRSGYTIMLQQTYLGLLKMGVQAPLDYELHIPMVMNRRSLRRVLKDSILWRSAYGNVYNIGGEQIDDVKFYAHGPLKRRSSDIKDPKSNYLSSEDKSFTILLKMILEDRFPNASQYELDQEAFAPKESSALQTHLQPL
jgi:hypothetical protein